MADKAKHAFGALERVDENIESGVINSYDVLFVKNAEGKPYVGWVDRDNNKVIVSNDEEIAALETELATKADAEEVDIKFGKMAQMYEIAKVPDGTLVDYDEHEIRVLIPADVDFTQNNGVYGAENTYCIEARIFTPEDAVRYRVNFGGTVTEGAVEDFAGCTDEYGRIYLVVCPPVAYYDTTSATWVYYGANSTTNRYIGWNLIVNFYDENDVMIASDSVRITLSNEDCHFEIKPYYMGEMMKEVDAKIEEKITEINTGYEIVEF